MSAVVYYLVIKPLSYLPLRILYVVSDLLYLVIYKLVGYRTEVVKQNIRNSFPNLTKKEQKKIVSSFYRHFCDLMIESLKAFSISEEEIISRIKARNPELLNKFANEGRNIILVAGHYNNWELLATGLNPQIKHTLAGVYAPLTNPYFEKKFAESRTKFGLKLIKKREADDIIGKQEENPIAYAFVADQSPQFIRPKTYWTTFLNQETAVMYGTEKYAVKFDMPVIFTAIEKISRGYYEIVFTLLEGNPREAAYCHITEQHTRSLEKQILKAPEYYLWTHKRWKHKKPEQVQV